MRIAVLGNSPNDSYFELVAAAKDRCRLTFVTWNQLVARVGQLDSVSVGTGGFDASEFDVCLVRGMPHGSLEQVIFRMNALARWQAGGMQVINSARALEIAIDKYLSLAVIRQAGLSVPESMACQTVNDAMDAFRCLGQDVVIKPVFGGEGRGMVRVTDPEIARRSFQAIVNFQGVIFIQRFIDGNHRDHRLLVVGEHVLGMTRTNPLDWRSNASLGANCQRFEPDQDLVEMAKRAAHAVGTEIAGVDFIADGAGNRFVLEVNGVPGWRHISHACDVDVAELVVDYLMQKDVMTSLRN